MNQAKPGPAEAGTTNRVAMSRPRLILAVSAFLATWLWLLSYAPLEGAGSLWPSLLAIGLAFATRDIYASLFLGALAGAVLLRGGDPFGAFLDLFAAYLIPALTDPWNISVLVFTLLMGGFVEVLQKGGGMEALARRVLGHGATARRAGLGAYALGWLVFFDGLANAMLVGKSMRSLADRAGLSRAKLAFIIDSTASPIAGVALVSTWIAYEMSMIQLGFDQTGNAALSSGISPFELLVRSLPQRFYCYYILFLVFLTVWLARDWGPMWKAESAARAHHLQRPSDQADMAGAGRIWTALVPLALLLAGVFVGLYVEGGGTREPFSLGGVIAALGQANAALVFVWATAGASLAALLADWVGRRGHDGPGPVEHFLAGMKNMFLPTLILVLAWTLNGVIKKAGTAEYLAGALDQGLAPGWLPAVVFLLAALVSFSTGTSWGTMALLTPLVIPVAVQLTGTATPADIGPVLIGTIGAVLTGAVFGDHCSPISDTTIVASFSSDCEVMEHVRTQMPYAVAAALLAVVVGYAPGGFGVPAWVLLPLGGLACWGAVRYAGRHHDV